MSIKSREVAIQAAVQAWCKKYDIRETDPMRGIAEIFEIYLGAHDPESQTGRPDWFEEFSESLDALNQRVKGFTKLAAELSSRIRNLSPGESVSVQRSGWATLLSGALVFTVGLALGRFVL